MPQESAPQSLVHLREIAAAHQSAGADEILAVIEDLRAVIEGLRAEIVGLRAAVWRLESAMI